MENEVRNGHDPATCTCIVAVRGRGEDPACYGHKKVGRKKGRTAARRGYAWFSNEDDVRIHTAAEVLGISCGEFVRQAVKSSLNTVETEYSRALEA